MPFGLIVFSYFKWHYSQALKDAFLIWRNFLVFIYRYFAVSMLFRTLFAPWRRIKEYYGRDFDLGKFFETLLVNGLMRTVGFTLKSAFITTAFILEFLTAIFGFVLIIGWLLAPFIVLFSLILGFYYFAA